MAYCALSDVEAIEAGRLQGKTYTTMAGYPSASQVTGFMAVIYDEINETILRSGFQVPITTNDYLKNCNAMGTAWLVEVALNTSGTVEAMNVVNNREKSYRNMLDNIMRNPRLAGALPTLGTQNNIATSDKVTNYNNLDSNVKFHINGKDW